MSENSMRVMRAKDMRKTTFYQRLGVILGKTGVYAFLLLIALIVLFPFYWMILSSLKSLYEYKLSKPTFWPQQVLLSNYTEAFTAANLGKLFLNTAYVGIVSTLLSLFITIITAFAFARLQFKGKELLFAALLGTMMIPEDFPYTVRLVSQVLESNGSSSMATVCAGTLALMDAGVPMKKPVSGIAMGLIKNPGEDKYAVLSDILGDEDHLGDMDFKTTGTRDGLTATQMDIKCDGLSFDILEKALMQAKAGREHILKCITDTIAEPRPELKPQVPRIEAFEIPKEFIGAVIGPGGKIIQQMQEDTGATITIDEEDGVGKIQVSGPNKEAIDAAIAKIKAIVAIPEVGEVYEGTVRSIMPYGCFVEFMPGKDGLLHISEIDWKRLETVEEAGIKEGDKITVKLLEIDPKTGKFKLSHRVLVEKPEGYVEPQQRRRERPERGERRQRPDHNERGERRPRPERGERRERNEEYHEPANEPKDFSDELDKMDF